jgi:ferric-dicitrate binding protein FerR (iron transport regulator)
MTDRDTAELFLFASGEMPPQQQDQFADRMAHDPQLAAGLAEIQSLTSRTNDYFTQAERREHPAILEARRSAAVRQVSRAIVQKRLEDSARAASAPHRRWKRPRWAYPVAAAALLIVGFIAFVQWGSNIQSADTATDEGLSLSEALNGSPYDNVRPPRSTFRNGVFGMEEADFEALQITANSYDVSSMFKSDGVN